ncbi:CsiV family protein [Legionella nagasakiensis]|uniref:CsiV family protein n=1 Tax=Legionella nagasakiensis TaxID=535290 RepID=UPI001054BB83|nr:CsiV family protein [Legionella nagasakiensis]
MLRVILLISLLANCCLGFAGNHTLYQIDLIVFTHQQGSENTEHMVAPLIPPDTHAAIPLRSLDNAMTPYHLLPVSTSQLRNEYWALNRKSQYRILLHYTWLQPGNNQRPVALSAIHSNSWDIEGTLRVRQSNYYLLDTELFFSSPTNDTSFIFSQKQRLKPNVVYYLDHPQAGMLIKIHKVA